jgi:hypothetical protein
MTDADGAPAVRLDAGEVALCERIDYLIRLMDYELARWSETTATWARANLVMYTLNDACAALESGNDRASRGAAACSKLSELIWPVTKAAFRTSPGDDVPSSVRHCHFSAALSAARSIAERLYA